jgi:hypothetical protein
MSTFEVADEVVFDAPKTKAKPTKGTKAKPEVKAETIEQEEALPAVSIVILSDTKQTYNAMCEAARMLAETIGHLPTYDITDADQMAKAKSDLALCRAVGKGTELAYETWNRPYLEARTENIKNRDTLMGIASVLGAHINDQIQAEARRKKAEKEARDKAQQERVDAHHEALAAMIALAKMTTAASAEITEQLARVQAPGFLETRDWEEFTDRAKEEHARVIEDLNNHLTNAQAREQLADLQRKAEDAERERQRVAALERRITDLELFPRASTGMGYAFIASQIAILEETDTAEFAELSERAEEAKSGALRDMTDMLEAAMLAEESARQIANQQAEQQRMLDAMKAIQDIQALTTQIVGTDIAALEARLAKAEKFVVSEAVFGAMAAVAQTTKDAAVTALGLALSSARNIAEQAAQEAARVAAEQQAEAARLKAEKEAEAARVQAEKDAQAARDEAARVAAEKVKANADRLLKALKDVVTDAEEAGAVWLSIGCAKGLIAELTGAQA